MITHWMAGEHFVGRLDVKWLGKQFSTSSVPISNWLFVNRPFASLSFSLSLFEYSSTSRWGNAPNNSTDDKERIRKWREFKFHFLVVRRWKDVQEFLLFSSRPFLSVSGISRSKSEMYNREYDEEKIHLFFSRLNSSIWFVWFDFERSVHFEVCLHRLCRCSFTYFHLYTLHPISPKCYRLVWFV